MKIRNFIFPPALVLVSLLLSVTAFAAAPSDTAATTATVTQTTVGTPSTSTLPSTDLPSGGSLSSAVLSVPSDDAQGARRISAAVSPALAIIAADSDMAKAGIAGNDIVFSEDDFARAMNLSRVDAIQITALPDSSDGALYLGTMAVNAGQRISRANLGLLSYRHASDGTGKAEFTVSVDDSGYGVTCAVYLLSAVNGCPTVDMTAQTLLSLDTHTDTAAFGRLGGYDPEGDRLTFEVIKRPDHGIVIINDKASGEYTYLPSGGYAGRDSFEYVVRDIYGNYSSSARVSLTVSVAATPIVYSDMSGNRAASAAISLTEKGIMSGMQVGAKYYFYPDGTVKRGDFLVMAMNAAGIKELPTVSSAGFYDDAALSPTVLNYAAVAKSLGYIDGSTDKNGNLCFAPDESLTRAEAALIVDRILNAETLLKTGAVVPTFADAAEVPDWAKSSVGVLNALGMLADDDGSIEANNMITRGQTAELLAAVMKLKEK